MSLPPEHQEFPKVSSHLVHVELEKCLAKTDWQEQRQRKQEQENLVRGETMEQPNAEDPNTLNLAKVKTTEWKNVKRVNFIENNEDPAECARRLLLKEELLKVTEKYIEKNFFKKEEN